MSLGAIGIMLGTLITACDFWRYHANHPGLRDPFWSRFYRETKWRIEAARLIGLFLTKGFQHGKVATEKNEAVGFLGAVVHSS